MAWLNLAEVKKLLDSRACRVADRLEIRMEQAPLIPRPAGAGTPYGRGTLSEVSYRTVDRPPIRDLRRIFSDSKSFCQKETRSDIETELLEDWVGDDLPIGTASRFSVRLDFVIRTPRPCYSASEFLGTFRY